MLSIETPLVLWQERFWDRVIRDQTDLNRHMDYIHYNPVKHGYVEAPEFWDLSTYCFWAKRGYYELGWGKESPADIAELEWE